MLVFGTHQAAPSPQESPPEIHTERERGRGERRAWSVAPKTTTTKTKAESAHSVRLDLASEVAAIG